MIIGFIDGYKSVKLFYRAFQAEGSRARVILLHGAGEYTEKYTRLGEWFAQKGIDVFMFDLRGHGKSGGIVCHVNDFSEYSHDLEIFAKFIDKGYGHKNTFLVSHSLGALISIFYSLNFTYHFDGLILCSPCLKIRLKIEPVKAWLALVLYKFLGKYSFSSNIKPRMATHDNYIIKKFTKDPLIHHFVTASLYVQVTRAMKFVNANAGRLKLPLLVLQAGLDKICDPKAAEDFYNASGSTDKNFKLYKGFYHELLNEADRELVYQDIYSWIKARC